ncbi:MAG: hypothetical protein CR982_09360 [Candidatus Cloacimonadota bacterium]|nr:MAG: hypothetical protein CR982_09360 [Candidatus Cloacimonadota bacterium]PIE77516.1 MAG: hypothetical protein CSA15_12650 [Candidatus Delongbacteria bacterium]
MKQMVLGIITVVFLIVLSIFFWNKQRSREMEIEFQKKYRSKNRVTEIVRGSIKDDKGNPMKGVTLELKGENFYTTKTGDDGFYYINGVRDGSYEITCKMDEGGYLTKKIRIRRGLLNKHSFIYYATNNNGFAHTKLGF